MPAVPVGSSTRKILAEGFYRMRIDKSEFRPRGNVQSGGSGNPLVAMEFVTQGNSIEATNGIRLYHTQTLIESTGWSTAELLEAVSGEEIEPDNDGNVEVDWPELVDSEVLGQVSIETYRGRKQNRVTRFFSVDVERAADGSPIVVEEDVEVVGAVE